MAFFHNIHKSSLRSSSSSLAWELQLQNHLSNTTCHILGAYLKSEVKDSPQRVLCHYNQFCMKNYPLPH